MTFYDEIGGHDTIALIVKTFYAGVAEDEVLRPMYPEADLARPRSASGCSSSSTGAAPPRTPSSAATPPAHAPRPVRGHPEARDRWLVHFRAGLDAADLPPEQDAQFWAYVEHAATFMVNTAS